MKINKLMKKRWILYKNPPFFDIIYVEKFINFNSEYYELDLESQRKKLIDKLRTLYYGREMYSENQIKIQRR